MGDDERDLGVFPDLAMAAPGVPEEAEPQFPEPDDGDEGWSVEPGEQVDPLPLDGPLPDEALDDFQGSVESGEYLFTPEDDPLNQPVQDQVVEPSPPKPPWISQRLRHLVSEPPQRFHKDPSGRTRVRDYL